MNQKERMLAGLPYKAWLDGLDQERTLCKKKIHELNHLSPDHRERIPELLKQLLGRTGKNIMIEPPFHCDYGWNIQVGENFFANYKKSFYGGVIRRPAFGGKKSIDHILGGCAAGPLVAAP